MTDQPQIAVTNPLFNSVRDELSVLGDLRMNTSRTTPWDADAIVANAPGAHALMTFMTDRVDAALLNRLPKLRIVACALKGYDSFDVAACTERGVWMTIVPDLLTAPTAELAVGLTIGVSRHVMAGDAHIRSGEFRGWRPSLYGSGLNGARVGILGMGRLGQAVAARLKSFNTELMYTDAALPFSAAGVRRVELEELAATSDFLIVCLPLTLATRRVVDTAFLRQMKPGAYLINPGRGSVVDESAVADALAAEQLAGYAADVFEMEDWSLPDRPREICPALLEMRDRTLFTPHLGSAVKSVRLQIEQSAARAIRHVFSGKRPDGAVNDIGG